MARVLRYVADAAALAPAAGRRRWTYPHRRPGRPSVDDEVRLARENGHWGYVPIVGELRKLGISVSATLVRNVLARAGIPPAPERAGPSWRSFPPRAR
jgi:hypothetical protein